MMNFLRENWLWIVTPIVLVVLLVAIVVALSDGDTATPFIYNI